MSKATTYRGKTITNLRDAPDLWQAVADMHAKAKTCGVNADSIGVARVTCDNTWGDLCGFTVYGNDGEAVNRCAEYLIAWHRRYRDPLSDYDAQHHTHEFDRKPVHFNGCEDAEYDVRTWNRDEMQAAFANRDVAQKVYENAAHKRTVSTVYYPCAE